MSTPQDPFRPPSEGEGAGGPWRAGEQPGWKPPQPGWGQPGGRPPFGTSAGPPRNGVGTAAVVLGALSIPAAITILGGIVFGLVAIVLGVTGRRRAREGTATNSGAATAGVVLGVLGLVVTAAVLAAGVSLLRSDTGRSLVDCLQDAADQVAVEQCQRQFEDELIG